MCCNLVTVSAGLLPSPFLPNSLCADVFVPIFVLLGQDYPDLSV